jgi:hypothetical protein
MKIKKSIATLAGTVFAAALLICASAAEAQVAVGRLLGNITYGEQRIPLTGWIAYLDISSGQLLPVGTPPLAPGACANGAVQLQTTADFARQQGTLVAINANLGPALGQYTSGTCGTPYGLLVSGGSVINVAQENGPALAFTSNTSAAIGLMSAVAQVTYAVAGWTGSSGGGTVLVVPPAGQGPPTPGTNTQPAPGTIAPRIGAGITADGKTLILAMIDGLEPSLGIRNPDFGNVMIGLGANAAINLDGGGSSTFIFSPDNASLTTPPALSTLLTAAAAPQGASNGLSFSVISMALDQSWTSAPPCVQPCAYRPIYANLGFMLAPSSAAKPLR